MKSYTLKKIVVFLVFMVFFQFLLWLSENQYRKVNYETAKYRVEAKQATSQDIKTIVEYRGDRQGKLVGHIVWSFLLSQFFVSIQMFFNKIKNKVRTCPNI